MYRFPANYDRASIAFYFVSLARGRPSLYSPGNVFTLKGLASSNTGDYGVQLSYDELEFSVTRDATCMYGAHVCGRSRSLLNVEAVLNSVSFAARNRGR